MVVKFLRDASSFFDALFKPHSHISLCRLQPSPEKHDSAGQRNPNA
jgi:hypothetical protein